MHQEIEQLQSSPPKDDRAIIKMSVIITIKSTIIVEYGLTSSKESWFYKPLHTETANRGLSEFQGQWQIRDEQTPKYLMVSQSSLSLFGKC